MRPLKHSTYKISAALAALALILSACGEDKAPERRSADVAESQSAVNDAARGLIDAIKKPILEGGELVASVSGIDLEIDRGGVAMGEVRVRNEGDTPVTISAVNTAIRSPGTSLGQAGCLGGTILQPDEFCDLFLTYEDLTGRELDNAILISSDAKKTPQLNIGYAVSFKPEPVAPSTSDGTSEPAIVEAAPAYPIDLIARANEMRRQSGFGGMQQLSAPEIHEVTRDEGYAEDAFAYTTTSLPVDRTRILTVDRTIKAVLETPFNNVMCSRVIAVADQDVFGADGIPGRDLPLIPAGTRFIGQCDAFTDEKAGIVWTRFITPNGVSARILGGSQDAMGRGGLPGELDRRWFDKYGVPLVFSSLRSFIEYLVTSGSETTTTVTDLDEGRITETSTPESRAIDRFQSDADVILGNVMNELRDTQEVLNIPGGTRIDIVLGEDIYFKDPYEVVSLEGVEYSVATTPRQEFQAPRPQPIVASQAAGGVRAPEGAQQVVIDGVTYYLVRGVDDTKAR